MFPRPPMASGCGFCRRNRESAAMVASHQLKDELGRVVCPQLSKYRCPGCGATGSEAHTRSYCPNLVRMRVQHRQHLHHQQQQQTNSLSPSSNSSSLSIESPASQQCAIATPSIHGQHSQINPNLTTGCSTQHNHNQQQQQVAAVEEELVLELGPNRAFHNMSRVTNSRYNSAGQLRDRRHRYRHQSANQFNPQQQFQQRLGLNYDITSLEGYAAYAGMPHSERDSFHTFEQQFASLALGANFASFNSNNTIRSGGSIGGNISNSGHFVNRRFGA